MNLSTHFPSLPQEEDSTTSFPFSLPPRNLVQVVAESLFAFLFVVLGSGGNVLVLLAVWKEKSLRTVPNAFVVNLAVTDFLFSVAVLPLTGVTYAMGEWSLGMRGCEIQAFLFGGVLNATLVTMTAISINRFIMIRHRGSYKNIFKKSNVKWMIVAIWCYSIIMASRPFFGLGRPVFNPNNGLCSVDKKPESASKISQFLAYLVLYTNILVILRCYIGVYQTVCRHRRQINERRGSLRQSANPPVGNQELRGEDIKIAKTLFIVICLFGVCWFPTAIIGIVVLFGVHVPGDLQVVLLFTIALASVVNPIVYAVRNKKFLRTYKRLFTVDTCVSPVVDRVQRISTRPHKDPTTL